MTKSEAAYEMPDAMTLYPVGASDISPSAMAEFCEGMRWMEAGDSQQAISALTRCVQQAPEFTAGHLCLGVAHAVSCGVYPAMDHLEKAVALEPGNFAAQYTLAQFYFKLRIPVKGYEHAELALAAVQNIEQRKALAQLLKTERERERNGISRPLFDRKFGMGFRIASISGLAALLLLVITHIR